MPSRTGRVPDQLRRLLSASTGTQDRSRENSAPDDDLDDRGANPSALVAASLKSVCPQEAVGPGRGGLLWCARYFWTPDAEGLLPSRTREHQAFDPLVPEYLLSRFLHPAPCRVAVPVGFVPPPVGLGAATARIPEPPLPVEPPEPELPPPPTAPGRGCCR